MLRPSVQPHIAVLTPCLSRGGVTRAYLLAQVLAHLGYRAFVTGWLPDGEELYPVPPPGVRVEPIAAQTLLQLTTQLLRRCRKSTLFAVKPKASSFGTALLLRLVGRVPIVLDVDDWELDTAHSPVQYSASRGRRFGFLRLLHQPDSPDVLNWLESHTSLAQAVTANTRVLQTRYRACYLPSGKDTRLFDPAHYNTKLARKAFGLDGLEVLLFPGTVIPHKGLDDVVSALELLKRPKLRLVLAGGRDAGNHFSNAVVRTAGHCVLQLPRQSQADMPMLIAAAHAVVVPQRDTHAAKAQFPMKLTDAMAMARPVIATRVGDIPEIVDNTAYLADPSSPEQLARLIAQVLDNSAEAEDRGQAGRRRCIDAYSIPALAQRLAPVLAGL